MLTAARLRLIRVALIAMLVAVFGFVATQRADAAWAYNTGWHTVCANDLTLYNNGPIGTFYYGAEVHIDHFADSGNHAWISWYRTGGTWYGVNGWVYNGWFC
jgi:hypothetical protein